MPFSAERTWSSSRFSGGRSGWLLTTSNEASSNHFKQLQTKRSFFKQLQTIPKSAFRCAFFNFYLHMSKFVVLRPSRKRVPAEGTFAFCGTYGQGRSFFLKTGLTSLHLCVLSNFSWASSRQPLSTHKFVINRFFSKKMPERLHMCKICCTFAAKNKITHSIE